MVSAQRRVSRMVWGRSTWHLRRGEGRILRWVGSGGGGRALLPAAKREKRGVRISLFLEVHRVMVTNYQQGKFH